MNLNRNEQDLRKMLVSFHQRLEEFITNPHIKLLALKHLPFLSIIKTISHFPNILPRIHLIAHPFEAFRNFVSNDPKTNFSSCICNINFCFSCFSACHSLMHCVLATNKTEIEFPSQIYIQKSSPFSYCLPSFLFCFLSIFVNKRLATIFVFQHRRKVHSNG
jgi:hypothetical protein